MADATADLRKFIPGSQVLGKDIWKYLVSLVADWLIYK